MKLYLVPTPIGNLRDMTYRAVEVLKSVDAILCEDTRTSSILLNHYQISRPLIPYHQHNEHQITQQCLEKMQAGKTLALITDAGTPGISDPAFLLVRACVQADIVVECLPGATSFIPALATSGIPMNRFAFEGFIPVKKGRQTFLTSLEHEERTMVFFESPMRLIRTLNDMIAHFGAERKACVARELSKMFEEKRRGTLQELASHYTLSPVKGEIVLVVAGKDAH